MEEILYPLGDSNAEIFRLSYQHQLWAIQAHSAWKESGFSSKQKLLDMGCGPGFTTLELAKIVGAEGKVYALDHSSKYLSYLKKNADYQGLKWIEPLHQELNHFVWGKEKLDGIYARMVFLFLNNPEEILSQLWKALKPKGILLINDLSTYDFHFSHSSPFLKKFVLEAPKLISQEVGIDKKYPNYTNTDLIKKLPEFALKAGFEIKKLQQHSQIIRPQEFGWDWLKLFIENYMPKLMKAETFSPEEEKEVFSEWERLSNQKGAFLITPHFIDIILSRK